jgi:hypothetical protein
VLSKRCWAKAVLPMSRAASVTRDLRSSFADDEIALPMAGLAAAFNGFRTIMD